MDEKDLELLLAALGKMEERVNDENLVVEETESFIKIRYSSILILMDKNNYEITMFVNNRFAVHQFNYGAQKLFISTYNAIIERDKERVPKKEKNEYEPMYPKYHTDRNIEKIKKEHEKNLKELNAIFN